MKNTVAFLLMLFGLALPSGARAKIAEKVIYSFAGGGSGSTTTGVLTLDKAGNLYGVAAGAGTGSNGVVFELTPAKAGRWTKTDLYSFGGGSDGSDPEGGVIFDKAGNLYGATSGGGSGGSGTVFELTPGKDGDWTETVLYSFKGGSDGGSPDSILIFDKAGNLYGTTPSGGSPGRGTVFELTPGQSGRWTEKVLHAFKGHTDGALPFLAGVIFDRAGNLYSPPNWAASMASVRFLNCRLLRVGSGLRPYSMPSGAAPTAAIRQLAWFFPEVFCMVPPTPEAARHAVWTADVEPCSSSHPMTASGQRWN
jgi:uncharacterized repeat protein (TIGR03803 family)